MIPFETFHKAMPYDRFLAEFGTPADRSRWDSVREQMALDEGHTARLAQFRREMPVLVLAGAWCGDCAGQCPLFERFAEAAPSLIVRYLDRDAFPEAQAALQINGGNRVPVVVFFSEDGHEVARYGERTYSTYRRMVSETTGEVCGSGIVGADQRAELIEDWLREFERAQWILRLSPRLRRLHGD